jgi:hypothetical protein
MSDDRPSSEAVVAAAHGLLADGATAEAADLLLNEGYVRRLDLVIQRAYLELVPVTPTLRAVLDGPYRGLDDPDPKTRFAAATRISRELSKATLRDNVLWMRDPRASEPLLTAVRDVDRKVSERAFAALTRLLVPYFPDQRALPVLREKLGDRKQQVRREAVGAIGGLRQERFLQDLVPLFDHGADLDRAAVASTIAGLSFETSRWIRPYLCPLEWSDEGRRFWIAKMIAALRDPCPLVRRQAAVALKHFGDLDALPYLRAAREVEPEDDEVDPAHFMDDAIAWLDPRPQQTPPLSPEGDGHRP